MRHVWIYIAQLAVFCVRTTSSQSEEQLVSAINCFALRFYKALAEERNNLVTSPIGVDVLLNALLTGAGGQTFNELKNALGYEDISITDMQNAFKEMLLVFHNSRANNLKLANSLWIQKSHSVKKKFRVLARDVFSTDVFSVDFEKHSRNATNEVNSWVKEKTEGLISELFTTDFDPITIAVLANAVFFKGQWAKRFSRNGTRKGIFHNHGSNIDTSEAELMTQQGTFNYKFNDKVNAQILEMDYLGKDLSMIVYLPRNDVKFEYFEQSLTCGTFAESMLLGFPTTVDVTMPIFEVTSDIDLQSTLSKLGIQRVFDPSANLSGICRNVYVSKALQRAVFAVSEEGSKASSATGFVAGKRTVVHPPEFAVFRADRPFMFLLRDKRTKLVLFMGKLTEFNFSHF